MAIKFQYNKTSLGEMRKKLQMRQRALPTIKSKESALRLEVKKARDAAAGAQERMEALVARADSAISELFGVEAIHGPSSTDANIPLAAGIPAVCVSAAVGRGCHTRQEEIDLDQLPNGAKLSMRLMQEYFEI